MESAPTPAAPEVAEGQETTEAAPEKPAHPEATEEQKQVLADLHWLVHQGHVIEFASGELDTATASAAKLFTTEQLAWVLDECLQLHGGYGYMREYPIARAWP